ncbi:MAG: DUF488 domain-containing protein [Candidatus Eremiobacteraeota bacterium]|nr:DUF488 domain-containing protein [Candidatus Eremiobacteraeota bacterium]
MRIHTFGHGTAGEEQLASLVHDAGVRSVIDVRSVPKSRAHPHVWAERLAAWLPTLSGATYRWCPELGGFRKPRPDSPNQALRHAAFRGYADYMQTPAFAAALDALLKESAEASTAIMCSETLWWRCHRRLIADALVLLHGVEVWHIMHAGALAPHRPTPEARVIENGMLQYDRFAE